MAKKPPPTAPGQPRAAQGSDKPGKRAESKTSKASTRAEKVGAFQRAQRRQRRLKVTTQWSAGVLALAGVVALLVYLTTRGESGDDSTDSPSGDLAGVESFEPERTHVTGPVEYPQTPPVGGPHNPAWLNCGVYDVEVPSVNAVHAMEHGAVWVTYASDLPAADLDALRGRLPDTYVVLSPFTDLPAPVVASAWGKQLKLTGADDDRLDAFVRSYRQGPQTPEPGAPCTGGVDASGRLDDGTLMP